MGLSPLPQHSFPVPKPLFESDRSSTPRCFQAHKRAGYSLLSETIHSCCILNSPKAITAARSFAGSYSLWTVGCFCWAAPEGSGRYNKPKPRCWPQNPTPRNSDLLANLHDIFPNRRGFLNMLTFPEKLLVSSHSHLGRMIPCCCLEGQSRVSNALQLFTNLYKYMLQASKYTYHQDTMTESC